ncbi:3-deoxy-D-manno-octulosonic acid transferase [Methylovirgula sp. HY1]|uniref:3-deoxy-D-manno-octulosonic acid transferase n=1 Tax=Methylovirgula sp. HY1 TaxID=2822761 RepID=UPI001C764A61|nr:3-deoxy-D-manno-octulosonic acid transferase [Methylovirgula sp. HY1]QXX73216.1 3-deoxy-D-manno-octulosonic acid transferase [Methylovirgula sp. HY1]
MTIDLPILPLYRAVSAGLAPLSPLLAYYRCRRGQEDPARVAERFGHPSLARPPGQLAWFHGASVGESLALLPLLEYFAGRGFNILLSTGTATAAAVVAPRLPAGAFHQYLPFDVPKFLGRFLDHWQPDLALVAESEIWPNLFTEIRRRRIPLVLVNARISPRSFQRWRRVPSFIASLLEGVDLCLTQSEADGERFIELGMRSVQVVGNLKYDVLAPPADPQALALLAGRIGARPTWVAASTHPGEDAIIIGVHQALAVRFPDLLTIIVPRHPRRGAEIAKFAAERGVPALQRSRETHATALPGIYIADTAGELGLFYRLASVSFIGKSLVGSGGGQNPIEAARLGCAVLHGPHVGNFAEVYRVLDDARGGAQIGDGDMLAHVLAVLLTDRGKLRKMSRAASEAVERLGGAAAATMAAIEPHIAQIMLNQHA